MKCENCDNEARYLTFKHETFQKLNQEDVIVLGKELITKYYWCKGCGSLITKNDNGKITYEFPS